MLRHVWLVPVFAFLVMPCSFFISYGVAVHYNHTDAVFPFISDTLTLAPESCIFGQILNIGAVLVGLCVYLRHRQIVQFYGHDLGHTGTSWRRVSTAFLWLGLVSALGTSMVANFQETRLLPVHMVAAIMTFGVGILYGWGQTIFSYVMKPRMSGLALAHLRLFLSAAATILFIVMMSVGFAAPKGSGPKNKTLPIHWSPDDPGYSEHLVATFSEWFMVGSFMLFILSFAWELRDTHVIPPKLVLTGKLAEIAELHSDATQTSFADKSTAELQAEYGGRNGNNFSNF